MDRYAGRVALVTGASSGIGAAITQALQRHGLKVVGVARRVEMVKALELTDAPGKLYALQGDISNEESILSTFQWIKEHLGGVDILINNAGVIGEFPLTTGATADWKRILDVDVLGLCICTREAFQSMQERGVDDGFIIHINSVLGHIPTNRSTTAVYCAAKHAVTALLEGLRKDLVQRKSNIRCGQISPGYVRTEIHKNMPTFTPELIEKTPWMHSEDIADAVVYMLSQHPRVQVGRGRLAVL